MRRSSPGRGAQVVVGPDLPEAADVVVHAHLGTDALAELLQGLDVGDEARLLGVGGGIAVQAGHALGETGDVAINGFRRQLAGLRGQHPVAAPEVAQPVSVRGLGLVRHVVAQEGLHRRLVFADAEHVDLDAELVQRLLEIELPARQAFDRHQAKRIDADVARLRGDQVVALLVVGSVGVDRLARCLEAGDGGAELLQLGQAGTGKAVLADHREADAVVGRGAFQRLDEIAQQRLRGLLAGEFLGEALGGVEVDLLDQRAAGGDDQGEVVLDQCLGAVARAHPEQAQRHHQHGDHQQAVEPDDGRPEAVEEADDQRAASGVAHGGYQRGSGTSGMTGV